ncbi:uncharacterized protein LOC126890370 [Diabrotica virgifera virgifera]|uniref:Ig-like domain-containing protein n=2 Tax=Diabrotica virgifera virgifera TaxID=50390 RepID=A0ABM5KYD7_DIAVI|nr:uncharacterized protein LOC126890370 [Diabrotica virgifera virgifera]
MTVLLSFQAYFMIFSIFVQDILSLKNVLLTIEPNVVQRFNHSTLHCSYDLEKDILYSVKWYRGRYEFYRYTPSEYPNIKTFAVKGINVDEKNSNSTQVLLRDIDFNISGNFSCEVTTDAPFSTGFDRKTMVVVQIPEFPPTISVEGEPLDFKKPLKANCSCSPSKPKAVLMLLLNNLTVAKTEPHSSNKFNEMPSWSDLALSMTLAEEHFDGGRLILRCIAEIGDIYREEAVLKLRSLREPVPERVSAYSVAALCVYSRPLLQIIALISITSMLS